MSEFKDLFSASITENDLREWGFTQDAKIKYRWYFKDESITYDLDDGWIRLGQCWDFKRVFHSEAMIDLIRVLKGEELQVTKQE